MKHLAKIQKEFLKEAISWDVWTFEAQKRYLQQHPESKRKITAKPEKSENATDLQSNLDEKRLNLENEFNEGKKELDNFGFNDDYYKNLKLTTPAAKEEHHNSQYLAAPKSEDERYFPYDHGRAAQFWRNQKHLSK